jgi:hypothetical protein
MEKRKKKKDRQEDIPEIQQDAANSDNTSK